MRLPRYSIQFSISLFFLTVFIVMSFVFSNKHDVTISKLQRNTDFPILYIDTDFGKPIKTKEWDTKALFEFKDYRISGKIRCRGNSTFQQPKKPYLIKLNHEADFLGTVPSKKWVLLSNGTDNTSLRNAYATYLVQNIFTNQRWYPRYTFVNLVINNSYQGIYQLYEKINLHHLNLSEGSFLAVTNTRDTKTYNFRTEIKNIGFSLYDPDENQSESEALEKIKIINKAEEVLFSDNFKDKENGWRKYIEEKELIDWYWINEFTTNRDARMRDSVFMYYNADDKKLHFGPSWDFDISCGNNDYPENYTTEGYWIRNNASWFQRLFEDEDFNKAVNLRCIEKMDQLKESLEWITKSAEDLTKAKDYDDRIWRVIGHYQWPHAQGWMNRRTYKAEVDYFYQWVYERISWLEEDISEQAL